PLEEVARLYLLAELLGRIEVVPHAVDLTGARLATRRGHVHDGIVQLPHLHKPVDNGVLPCSGGRRDDHEQTFAVDAHDTSANSGVRDDGIPRRSRYATRSGA